MNAVCLKHNMSMTKLITREHIQDTYIFRCEECIKEEPDKGVKITL